MCWDGARPAPGQLADLLGLAKTPGVLVVRFEGPRGGAEPLDWSLLEAWTRSRAVTVADMAADPGVPGLDLALAADLVVLREGVDLRLPGPGELPSPGIVWAAGRAGPRALRRILLGEGPLAAEEALDLGLVHRVVGEEAPLPLPRPLSGPSLTIVRDLLRSRAAWEGALALEQASFRLLFALGHPREGARAFLERRAPEFGTFPRPD